MASYYLLASFLYWDFQILLSTLLRELGLAVLAGLYSWLGLVLMLHWIQLATHGIYHGNFRSSATIPKQGGHTAVTETPPSMLEDTSELPSISQFLPPCSRVTGLRLSRSKTLTLALSADI